MLGGPAFAVTRTDLLRFSAVVGMYQLAELHENDECLQVAWGPLTLIAFVGTAHASDVRTVWKNDREIIARHGTLSSITVMLGELQMRAPDDVKALAAEMTADLSRDSVGGAVVVPWDGLPGAFFRALLAGIYLLGRVRTPNKVFARLPEAIDWVLGLPGQSAELVRDGSILVPALLDRLAAFERRMQRSSRGHRADLASALLEMAAEDDETRDRLARDGSLFVGYHPEMEAVHRRNAARVRGIIDAHGWPGRSLVGDEAASAAWRIVQHAISEPAFMRACLTLVQAAVNEGEADPREAAMLEDRIRVLEGRAQRYGTQYDWDERGTAMIPTGGVEDPNAIDTLRANVGLTPMEWRRAAPPDEPPPPDLPARNRDMLAWMQRVGWRPPTRD